jgi:DNA-binding IclR family transcriptional regulator
VAAALTRGLRILQLLSRHPGGLPLGEIAHTVQLPASAVHRLLAELVDEGYVRQASDGGAYALSMKVISQALTYLSEIDLIDQAKPAIDRLAKASKALVRLCIVDDARLIWVLKSQGSTSNITYDPPVHYDVRLSCSSSGYAWMAHLTDEEALTLVLQQGLEYDGGGPNAPQTIDDVLAHIHQARAAGYGVARETYERGITSISTAIINPDLERVTGALSIAGLSQQFTNEYIDDMLPLLIHEAGLLGEARLDYAKYLVPTKRSKAITG